MTSKFAFPMVLAALALWASASRACDYGAQAFVLPASAPCYQAQAFSLGYAAPAVRVQAFAVQSYAAPVVVERQAFAYGHAAPAVVLRQEVRKFHAPPPAIVVERQAAKFRSFSRREAVIIEARQAPRLDVDVDVRRGLFGRQRLKIRSR